MTYMDTPQNFIRALKAQSDPPKAGDPSKIEIALTAWHTPTFVVPSKAEAIVDFILTRLLKDRGRDPQSGSNPTLDIRYWTLLADILYPSTSSSHQECIKAHKVWLLPFLGRTPLAPIVESLLALSASPTLVERQRIELYRNSRRVLMVLWPLAVNKIGIDALLECFGALLVVMSREDPGSQEDEDENILALGGMIISAFKSSLANASNKRKLHQTFTHTHLENWFEPLSHAHSTSISSPSEESASQKTILLREIYSTGADILFNPDTLRAQLAESTSKTVPSFSPFLELCSMRPQITTPLLPRLLTSFTSALRRYRTALFGTGEGGVVDVRNNAFAFFEACEDALCRAEELEKDLAWRTRVQLLHVVENERLSVGGMEHAEQTLKKEVEKAVEQISAVDVDSGARSSAFEVLCVLSRIDHDLVDPSVPSILTSILLPPTKTGPPSDLSSSPPLSTVSALLSLILAHHTQTRTLPTYLSRLLTSLTPPFSSSSPTRTIQSAQVYQLLSTSPLLSRDHLAKLSRACRTYITPGQALSTVEEVLKAWDGVWEKFLQAPGRKTRSERSSKKKKSDPQAMIVDVDDSKTVTKDEWAIGFSLAEKIMESVIISLPMQNVHADVAGRIKSVVEDALHGYLKSAVDHAVSPDNVDADGKESSKKKKRKYGQEDERSGWAIQVIGAAALRFINTVKGDMGNTGDEDGTEHRKGLGLLHDLVDKVLGAIKSSGTVLPELKLELFRALFNRGPSLEAASRDSLIDLAYGDIEQTIASKGSYPLQAAQPVRWLGMASQLVHGEEGVRMAGIALLRLVTGRFLDILDIYGTSHLERLVDILFSISQTNSSSHAALTCTEPGLTPGRVLTEMLRSADFWERQGVRTALMSTILSRTAALDAVDVLQYLYHNSTYSTKRSKAVKSPGAAGSSISGVQTRDSASAYSFLLYAPTEYVTRSARNELLRRAVALDSLISSDLASSEKTDGTACSGLDEAVTALTMIRAFLARTFAHVGAADHPFLGEYLYHLIMSGKMSHPAQHTSTNVTLSLIQIHITTILRAVDNDDEGRLVDLVKCLKSVPLGEQDVVYRQSVLLFIKAARKDRDFSSFSAIIQHALRGFSLHVTQTVMPAVESMVAQKVIDEVILDVWCNCVLLAKWMGSDDLPSLNLGKQLVALLTSPDSPQLPSIAACKTVLFVMSTELECCQTPDTRQSQLEIIVAAYVLFCRLRGSEGHAQFDETLASTSTSLSISEYSFALDLVHEALTSESTESDLVHLVHLSELLLHEAPQGTMKVIQSHITRCFDTFGNHAKFYDGQPSLRHQVLSLVNSQCSDNPASLRAVNLPAIWTLVSKVLCSVSNDLSPSTLPHDAQTHPEIFQLLTSIISALVRLRRDLVLTTLPHLCIVLRQLIFSLRNPRPDLGRKQYSMVISSLPRWINPSDRPLGADEAKALARLLTTLATKSVIRTFGSNSAASLDSQKPESLARPLGKHIAYVLQAYLEIVNDPLCIISVEVRRELMPGLFILCGMMNEHARDALMVSIPDGGQKAILKALWREYEKQKYVGKG